MRVALYARVSTAEEKEMQDPETQLMILRDYCKVYEHEITATFVDHCSGKDPNRPEFSKMMVAAKLKSRPFDAIICLRIDRFMRSALYGLQATQELQEVKCGLIFVRDQIDTTTPQGQLFYTMQLAFAECERGMIGKRVSEGIQRRIRQGGSWGKSRRDVNVNVAVELLRGGKASSVSEAARILGIPRATLIDHAKRKNIDLTDIGLQPPSKAPGSSNISEVAEGDGLRSLKS